MKSLKPEVAKEKDNIETVLNYIKNQKMAGEYSISSDEVYEEAYLKISEKAVADIKNEFPDLEPGFAFYVVDRYGSDLIDEN